jgi:hypothetical protein
LNRLLLNLPLILYAGQKGGNTMKKLDLQIEELENAEEMMSNDDFYLTMSAVGVAVSVIIVFT